MASAAKPLRADARRNRERILAAAKEVFGRHGLDATLDDVAAAAGVGVGTVYRRYSNKHALLEELLREELERVVAEIEAAAEGPDAWQALVTLIERIVGELVRNHALDDVLNGSAAAREQVAQAQSALRRAMAKLIERAKAEGKLREDFARTDVKAILTMATAVGRELGDVWPRYLALLVDGMRRRRDHPSPLPVCALTERELDQRIGD